MRLHLAVQRNHRYSWDFGDFANPAAFTGILTSVGDPSPSIQLVFCTCSSQEEARRIARNLVDARLAACVNILPAIESIYRWNDTVETSNEALLIIKTSLERFPALRSRILEIHSYDVPEIVAVPISEGSEPYLAWLRAQL